MRIYCGIIVFVVTLPSIGGCTKAHVEPKPQTQKVDGKVVLKDGSAFTKGGAIEFRHDEKEGVSAQGEIKADGAFQLYTVTAQHKVIGAVEGSYTVTIIPPAPDQNVQPIAIRKKYSVAPGDNQLTVVIGD